MTPADLAAYRAAYRARIRPRYAPRAHAAFVLGGGLAVVGWQLHGARLDPASGLAFAAGLVLFNVAIHVIHRELGHRRRALARPFHQRHALEHHRFFDHTPAGMAVEHARDLRVVLFPPWLLGATVALALAAGAAVARLVTPPAGHAATGALVAGYVLYEAFHLCHHLPDGHPLARVPWLAAMRRHHRRHHEPAHASSANFDIVLPLTDWLLRRRAGAPPAPGGGPT